MGRLLERWKRIFIDGNAISGYGRSISPLGLSLSPTDVTAQMSDVAHGYLPNRAEFSQPVFNAVMDDTAIYGSQVILSSFGSRQIVVMYGDGAAPAIGDFMYFGVHRQGTSEATNDSGAVTITAKFGGVDTAYAQVLDYQQCWGRVVQPWASKSGTNAANTNVDNGAASTKGGIFIYQIAGITGAGTLTLTIEESATGVGAWSALTGATSGAIANASCPAAGYAQLATNAAVKQYLRPQWAFGGAAVSAYFLIGFIRGL